MPKVSNLETSGENKASTEEDKSTVSEMLAEKVDYEEEAYLKRGALICCDKGTHPRRINIQTDHGIKIKLDSKPDYPYPFLTEAESQIETNISCFGICQSETPPGSDTIILNKYTPDGEEPSTETINGPMCKPVILDGWLDTKEDVQIKVDGEYKKVITSNSCLVCACKGLITVYSEGLDYDGSKDS